MKHETMIKHGRYSFPIIVSSQVASYIAFQYEVKKVVKIRAIVKVV